MFLKVSNMTIRRKTTLEYKMWGKSSPPSKDERSDYKSIEASGSTIAKKKEKKKGSSREEPNELILKKLTAFQDP